LERGIFFFPIVSLRADPATAASKDTKEHALRDELKGQTMRSD